MNLLKLYNWLKDFGTPKEPIVSEDSDLFKKPVSTELSFEEQEPLFFDDKVMLEQPERVYRIDNWRNGRYYYTMKHFRKENKGQLISEPVLFQSVTNLISSTMPSNYFLNQWTINKALESGNADAGKEFMEERAVYGTFMHIEFSSFFLTGEINFDTMENRLHEYLIREGEDVEKYLKPFLKEARKDVLAFIGWVTEYNVRPFAIELVLTSKNGYAGAVDLLCELDIEIKGFWGEVYKSDGKNNKKGDKKETKKMFRVPAIVDYKSGKKGFYESNELQLGLLRNLVEENFPHLKDKNGKLWIFNLGMSDWQTEPAVKFKDQSGSKNLEKLPHLIGLSKINSRNMKTTELVIAGTYKKGEPVEKHIKFQDVIEEIKGRH